MLFDDYDNLQFYNIFEEPVNTIMDDIFWKFQPNDPARLKGFVRSMIFAGAKCQDDYIENALKCHRPFSKAVYFFESLSKTLSERNLPANITERPYEIGKEAFNRGIQFTNELLKSRMNVIYDHDPLIK